MLVVSDTSPITALLQTGLAHLLPDLFQRVIIPPAVRTELLRAHPVLPEWLEVRAPLIIPAEVRAARLDPGETEAIASRSNFIPMSSCSTIKRDGARRSHWAFRLPACSASS